MIVECISFLLLLLQPLLVGGVSPLRHDMAQVAERNTPGGREALRPLVTESLVALSSQTRGHKARDGCITCASTVRHCSLGRQVNHMNATSVVQCINACFIWVLLYNRTTCNWHCRIPSEFDIHQFQENEVWASLGSQARRAKSQNPSPQHGGL